MSELLSTELQHRLLQDLLDLIDDRAVRENKIVATDQSETETAEKDFQQAEQQRDDAYQQACNAYETEFQQNYNQITSQFETEFQATQSEYQHVLREISSRYDSELASLAEKHQDAQWLANSVFDESASDSPKPQFEAFKNQRLKSQKSMAVECQRIDELLRNSNQLMQNRRMGYGLPPLPQDSLPADQEELQDRFSESAEQTQYYYDRLHGQILPRFFSGFRPLGLFLLFWLITVPVAVVFQINPMDILDDPSSVDRSWVAVSCGIGFGVSLVTCLVLHGIAKSRSSDIFQSLLQYANEAGSAFQKWTKLTKAEIESRRTQSKKRHEELVASRKKSLARFDNARKSECDRIEHAKETELAVPNRDYPQRLSQLESDRDSKLRQIEAQFAHQLKTVTDSYGTAKQEFSGNHEQQMKGYRDRYERDWTALCKHWTSGLEQFQTTVGEMNRQCRELFPEFSRLAEETWIPPTELPNVIPFGRYDIDLEKIENGISQDNRLVPATTNFSMPAILPFPDCPSLFIQADQDGRKQSVKVLQTVMLRLLTFLPPGKVRFTIFDPVGLGENFSAFMHLADYEELLINSRIWTNASDIENRLRDLTDHMETILQTYLRNDFSSIQEYNENAGEVAEPYHILVVANFPNNFTDEAYRRLVSIACSGPRCGVFTLISVDKQQPLSQNFDLEELKQNATSLTWEKDRFVCREPGFEWLPLEIDPPPDDDQFSKIVHAAGDLSKDVRRVEVPFGRIAPPEKQLWSRSSRTGIDIPLGRAGATKLQNLRLGKGTSQHVLVAGKTGSGKSSFLHALITNAALYYSPNEIEFYLIDFKKGVEFKTYATHSLPHARVIAIESDREFGLSTLRRLDAVMKERGDLFRQEGVQDLPSYRAAHPEAVLPRIMLIVDEFQEFFVEDDLLSQDASLLLDRLVRQGRAFGIHVLLGSQTLAGAYTIARSTLGQIGVRIALQCSDTDAHLILSEDNTAARLLARPGEAIYNDANGLVKGNQPFQIAWLPDERREACLQNLQELVRVHNLSLTPPIVFEGNVPSDPAKSPQLARFLSSTTWQRIWSTGETPSAPQVCVGEAVEIKDPISVAFHRQSGSNLLLVGPSPQLARGTVANSFLELATQMLPQETEPDSITNRLYLLDGGLPEQHGGEIWKRLADVVPHNTCLCTPHDAAGAIAEIRAEVDRRMERNDETDSPLFLFIFNLGRFRALRKKEDDFGFGNTDLDESASAAQQFGHILREGLAVGIHTIVWCDTCNNLSRWFSTQTLRELEMRIVFPMSPADSSNLIDSPAAAKLGANRALLYREDQGTLEKFRPFGPPSEELLADISRQFSKNNAIRQT